MDGFPDNYNLFPRVESVTRIAKAVGHFVFDHLHSEDVSDHASRGAERALDEALYDHPQLPFSGWDDCGREVPNGNI